MVMVERGVGEGKYVTERRGWKREVWGGLMVVVVGEFELVGLEVVGLGGVQWVVGRWSGWWWERRGGEGRL